MARIGVISVLVLLALSWVEATDNAENKAKLAVIKRETLLAADAIRNITIHSPEDKVQLASMANDFVSAFNYAVYVLNNVVPNIANEEAHKVIAPTTLTISNFAYGIQQAIPGDAEKLKEKLIITLEEMHKSVAEYEGLNKGYENQFINIQEKRKHDFILYGIYKLKFRATYFETPSLDLKPELDASVVSLSEAIKFFITDKIKEDEVRHALQHLTVITDRSVYKLENWIEVNPNNTEDIKLVEEVIKTLSELYEKENLAASVNHSTLYMKLQLFQIYDAGMKQVTRLVNVKYPENLGGQEFIRSVLFDAITIGRAYAANFKGIITKF